MATAIQKLGRDGEEMAGAFLEAAGYEIITTNYRTRFGEIDIIAYHTKPHFGKTLCFVEVKTRSTNDGSAERATGYHKQARIFLAAKQYCLDHKIEPDHTPLQFEQVSVIVEAGGSRRFAHYTIPVD